MRNGTELSASKRGRPRAFDEAEALAAFAGVFHEAGFEAASLDRLCAAAGLSRPSVYNAFGDKLAVYETVLRRYADEMRRVTEEATADSGDARALLRAFLGAALGTYAARGALGLGCLVFANAVVDAPAHPRVARIVRDTLDGAESLLARRATALPEGAMTPAEARRTARLAASMMCGLAVRARAGEKRTALRRLVDEAADALAGDAGPSPDR